MAPTGRSCWYRLTQLHDGSWPGGDAFTSAADDKLVNIVLDEIFKTAALPARPWLQS
jgi:hypothetical protein